MDKTRPKQVKNFPYLKRVEEFEKSYEACYKYNFKYTLKGVARNTVSGLGIYLTYFLSPFKNIKIEQSNNNIRFPEIDKHKHISQFFLLFIKIYVLKDCVCLHEETIKSKTRTVRNLLKEEQLEEKEKNDPTYSFFLNKQTQKAMSNFLDKQVQECYQKYKKQFKGNYQSKIQSIKKINQKINQLLQNFYDQKLEKQQNFKKLNEQEALPTNMKGKTQTLKYYIKNNFECIKNMHVLRLTSRREVLSEFYNKIKNHMYIKIQLLMQTLARSQKSYDSISLPKYSNETLPVLTSLVHYLQFYDRLDKENSEYSQQQLQIYQIMKSIVKVVYQYHQNTKDFYPNISINDFYFDMKALKPIISHNGLILDAIGFRGQTKNVELRLATEPTPANIFECISPLEPNEQYYLLRKYYRPDTQLRSLRNEYQCKEKTQQQKKELIVLEEIHVWKLINILYEVYHCRQMLNDLFYQKSGKSSLQIKQFTKIVKDIRKDMKQGKLDIFHLIPQQKNFLPKVEGDHYKKQLQYKPIVSSLKILTVAERLGIQADQNDSLLQSLKLTNIKQFIEAKSYFANEIMYIILHQKFFKRLMNLKKYFASLCINVMEELRFKVLAREPQYKEPRFEEQLLSALKNGIYHKEFKKRSQTINNIFTKIQEYRRRGNDLNNRILQEHFFKNGFNQIKLALKEIQLLEKKRQEISQIFEKEQQEQIKAMKNIFNESINVENSLPEIVKIKQSLQNKKCDEEVINGMKNVINKIMLQKSKLLIQKSQKLLLKFVSQEIRPYINESRRLHDQILIPFQNYVNTKLTTVINIYIVLNQQNFRKYQMIYSYSAFDIIREGATVNEKMQEAEVKLKCNNINTYNLSILREPALESLLNTQ